MKEVEFMYGATFTLGGITSNTIIGTGPFSPHYYPIAMAANGENAGTPEVLIGRVVSGGNFEFQCQSGANWTLPQCKIRFNATYKMA